MVRQSRKPKWYSRYSATYSLVFILECVTFQVPMVDTSRHVLKRTAKRSLQTPTSQSGMGLSPFGMAQRFALHMSMIWTQDRLHQCGFIPLKWRVLPGRLVVLAN